ncbi:MAG TPA: hypothetical protein ENK26_11885 [Gammaproteobacteria bacterium]|nr:hypothetical protein [Gammaproteobacteria bacterium]
MDKIDKLAEMMDDSEHNALAYMAFPRQHRKKLHSWMRSTRLFRGNHLFLGGATDLVAKRGA